MTGGDYYQELRALVKKWREHENSVTDLSELSSVLRRQWSVQSRCRRSFEALEKRVDEALSSDDGDNAYATVLLGSEFLKAAGHGNRRALDVFLQEGFPVNYQDPQSGENALHLTAGHKARKAIRSLLKHEETDYLIRDFKGRLTSEVAFLFGRDPALSRLLAIKERKQADRDGIWLTRWPDTHDRLIAAAEAGDLRGVKRAFPEGANVNYQSPHDLMTALHIAAGNGDHEMVDFLVNKRNADVTLKDKHGRTAAVVAIDCGNTEIADRLTELECNILLEERRKELQARPA